MDKFQSMSVFVEIADKGSLTAAAEALGKSQPSVVRALAQFEKSLQVRLFNRTTRRVTLTEEGKAYLPQCRKILADIEEAERALGRSQVEPSGRIMVTAPVRFGELHVAPAVAGFVGRYPKAQVELRLLDRVVDILEEGVDIAVRISHLEDSSLVARLAGSTRQVVCARPALIEEIGLPSHPMQLSEMPCIRFTGMSARSEWNFQESRKQLAVPVSGNLICNQVGASLEACEHGVGFGRFFCYQVMPKVNEGKLSIVLQDFEPAPTPINVVFPHSRLLSARVRVMIDWLVEHLKQSLNRKASTGPDDEF